MRYVLTHDDALETSAFAEEPALDCECAHGCGVEATTASFDANANRIATRSVAGDRSTVADWAMVRRYNHAA